MCRSAGYEPLEWTGHAEYAGPNATAWQAEWLRTIWASPSRASANETAFEAWRRAYLLNRKLDPSVHSHAPLTVRSVTRGEAAHAAAIGFKVRPLTVETNQLAPTLRGALHALGGVVLTVNRRDKLRQSVSLFRRRFEGRSGQFGQPANGQGTSVGLSGVSIGDSASPHARGVVGGDNRSVIGVAELSKLLDHRQSQVTSSYLS